MPKLKDKITTSTSKISRFLERDLPKEAYNFFKQATPKRTGNARAKTRLKGSTIDANYKYAVPLDKGSSRKAPKGMTQPTIEFVKRLLAKQLRK